jgi:hypothetical protein
MFYNGVPTLSYNFAGFDEDLDLDKFNLIVDCVAEIFSSALLEVSSKFWNEDNNTG